MQIICDIARDIIMRLQLFVPAFRTEFKCVWNFRMRVVIQRGIQRIAHCRVEILIFLICKPDIFKLGIFLIAVKRGHCPQNFVNIQTCTAFCRGMLFELWRTVKRKLPLAIFGAAFVTVPHTVFFKVFYNGFKVKFGFSARIFDIERKHECVVTVYGRFLPSRQLNGLCFNIIIRRSTDSICYKRREKRVKTIAQFRSFSSFRLLLDFLKHVSIVRKKIGVVREHWKTVGKIIIWVHANNKYSLQFHHKLQLKGSFLIGYTNLNISYRILRILSRPFENFCLKLKSKKLSSIYD